MVHDVQLDFYGKRLATCSSDQTVKIFDIDGGDEGPGSGQQQQQQQQGGGAGGVSGAGGQHTLVDTLRFHTGPVWCVAWGHPKFGSILASASYDGKVAIWREVAGGAGGAQGSGQQSGGAGFQPASTGTQTGRWERIKEHSLHGASGECGTEGDQRSDTACDMRAPSRFDETDVWSCTCSALLRPP